MKPGFALLLSHDSIGLLHRTAEGWDPLGEAFVADPELSARLADLRQTAEGVAGAAIASKLVIPATEVLYTTVTAPGPNAQTRRAQIRAALEGRTPYAVKELAFDWRGSGPEVQVAVVARETLAEAEAFAEEHGFGPMSFVASPDPALFPGEPWFGAARGADKRLKPGEKVERDNDPVPYAAPPSDPEPEIEPVLEPGQAATALSDPELPETSASVAELPVVVADIVASADEIVAADLPAEPTIPSAPAADLPAEPAIPSAPSADLSAEPAIPSAPAALDLPPPAALATEQDPVEAPQRDAHAPVPEPPPPRWLSDPLPDLTPQPAVDVDKIAETATLPPADELVPPPLARTSGVDVLSPALDMPPDLPDPTDDEVVSAGAAPAIARLRAKLAESAGDGRGVAGRRPMAVPLGPVEGGAARAPKQALRATAPGQRLTVVGQDARSSTRPVPVTRPPVKGSARSAASMITAPSIPLPRDRRVNIPAPDAETEARTRSEAEARKAARPDADKMGPFGSRPVSRGKPRYLGLILTGLLLLVLALVAAWSSFTFTSGLATDEVQVGTAADPAVATPPTSRSERSADLAAAIPAAPTDTAEVADVFPAGAEVEVPAGATVEAEPEAPPVVAVATSGLVSDAATLSTSGRRQDVAEAAVVVPPAAEPGAVRTPSEDLQDEIFLARSDPSVPTANVVALAPPVAATDAPPASQPLPPPFGTVYRFDAQGRIVPTAEGIVTPEGVRLVAGRPDIVPPERPAAPSASAAVAPDDVAPTADASAPTDAAPASDTASDAAAASVAGIAPAPTEQPPAAVGADPALADARPRARPQGLDPQPEPAPATAADDDAALPESAQPATEGTQVASPRPRERPSSVLAAGEAAQETVLEATLASLSAAAINPQVSPLAVAVSRKPAARPRDFSAAVSAAVAEVARAAVPEPPPAVAPEQAAPATIAMAAPKPKAEPEPEPEPAPRTSRNSRSDDPEEVEADEPEVARAAPSVPTRASVAKQATFRNAINLSKTNLIGVYGSSSNRYALVRQPNGRFVKVSVGDRVDGGKVAAISERELKYVKNGRTVTLSMPKS